MSWSYYALMLLLFLGLACYSAAEVITSIATWAAWFNSTRQRTLYACIVPGLNRLWYALQHHACATYAACSWIVNLNVFAGQIRGAWYITLKDKRYCWTLMYIALGVGYQPVIAQHWMCWKGCKLTALATIHLWAQAETVKVFAKLIKARTS